ncbi:hypothetical protein GJ744_010865 [Endocarpon pusillum]|uniref:Uncharacterized protein n=1 Tax=Endocarpon pusillum TaxID=364733 RepID=A0A8H7ADM1_9EURO|nr:hypothetical protein GJ744_010865 [Endocarpon pusillum]
MLALTVFTLLGPRNPIFGYCMIDIWSVLVAVAEARVKLKHAWFDLIPVVFFKSHIFAALEVQSIFRSLLSLKLNSAPSAFGKLPDLHIDSLQRFMAHCQQLRHLRVESMELLGLTVAVIGLSLPENIYSH